MDAKELTKKFYELENKNYDLNKRVEYLEQQLSKMTMLLDDLRVDFKMFENMNRGR